MKKLFLSFACAFLCTPYAEASWVTKIEDRDHMPSNLIVVDKTDMHLSFLEKKSPLAIRFQYPSIHGGVEGDKQIEGDLKTPEGVYFVTGKIQARLDFTKYGSEAHALNYPNPVDRLRGKTGSGIWIHSKGDPIATQRTEGCVAIDLGHIAELGPHIKAGMPVVLAQDVHYNNVAHPLDVDVSNEALSSNKNSVQVNGNLAAFEDIGSEKENVISHVLYADAATTTSDAKQDFGLSSNTDVSSTDSEALHGAETSSALEENTLVSEQANDAQILSELTVNWNNAWENRSDSFFDFYDAEAYSKAQNESFQKFKKPKEFVFKNMNWVHIDFEDIHVLEGAGYWVTWFNQLYQAPNHTAEGVRRLYWMKDAKGSFKIVGMEWLPRKLGLEKKYLEKVEATVPAFIVEWTEAWKTADVDIYSKYYTENAKQGSLSSLEVIMESKAKIWTAKKPKDIIFSDMSIVMQKDGVHVNMIQEYSDSTGYKDHGIKRLVLHPEGDSWRIAREDWFKR